MNDTWECAIRELMRRKNRTIVTILGYLAATSIILVMVNHLQISRRSADEVLKTVGTHFITFIPSATCCPKDVKLYDKNEGFVATGVTTKLFPANIVTKIKQLPTVEDASPYLSFRFKDEKDGHLFTVGGFDPKEMVSVGSTTCAPADLVNGRFIKPDERGLVMLEKTYADVRSLKIGDSIKIAGTGFSVIGIVAPATRPAKSDVYMHIDDAEPIIIKHGVPPFKNSQYVNVVLVEVKSSRVQDKAIDAVKEINRDLTVSGFACYRPAAKIMGMNEKSTWFLTIIIGLGTVGFSLKSQFSSVIERQHDIGILKAIGWSNKNVVSQILTESIILAIVGGFLGASVASSVVFFVPIKALDIETHVVTGATLSPLLLLTAILLLLLGGIIAGIFPALSVARKYPADALRRI